jgi:hypothetical protein
LARGYTDRSLPAEPADAVGGLLLPTAHFLGYSSIEAILTTPHPGCPEDFF